jgi:hypothetical protein
MSEKKSEKILIQRCTGEEFYADEDICADQAEQMLFDLRAKEEILPEFSFILGVHHLLRCSLDIMLSYGYTEEEMIGEVIIAKRDFDEETIH